MKIPQNDKQDPQQNKSSQNDSSSSIHSDFGNPNSGAFRQPIFFEIDKFGTVIKANESLEQLMCDGSEKIASRSIYDFLDSAFHKIFKNYIAFAITSSEKFSFDIKVKTKDRTLLPVRVTCHSLNHQSEATIQLSFDLNRHSDFSTSADDFNAWNTRLRLFDLNSSIGTFQTSVDGRLIYMNSALAKMMGYESPRDLMDILIDRFYEQIQINEDDYNSLKESSLPHHFEQKILRKDDSFFWASIHIQAISIDSSTIIQGTIENITFLRESTEMFRVQHSLGNILSGSNNFEQALGKLLEIFLTIDGLDCGGIYIFDQIAVALKLTVHSGISDRFAKLAAIYPIDSPQTKLIFKREIVFQDFEDITQQFILDEKILSYGVIPIYFQGEIIADVNVASRTEKKFPYLARYIIDNIASQIRNIMGRLWTENALKESEENFRALAANANDGILIGRDEGAHFYVNDRFCEMTGFTREELMEKIGLKELVPPEEFERIRSIFRARMFGQKVPFNYETRLIRKDLKEIQIEVTTSKTTWKGMPVGLVFIRDITRRRLMEQELRESEENFRALAANANDGIMIATGNGKHEYVNKRASEITGFSQDELLNMGFRELAHPDELAKIASRYSSRISGGEVPQHYETKIVNKNGDSVPIEITGAKTIWHGKPADIVIIRDVSHRKMMERALIRSEKQYRAIVEQQTELIGRITTDGTFVYVNRAICAYYGTSSKFLLGKNLYTWFTQREKDIFLKKFSLLDRDKPITFTTHRLGSTDNKVRWQQWSVRAIFNEENMCKEYQFVGRDITKLKMVQKELKQHKNHLEKLVEKRTRRLSIANKLLHEEINERKKVEEELRIKDDAINSSINAFALADLHGNITYVNQACLDMLHMENENEIVGTSSDSHWTVTQKKSNEIKHSLFNRGNWRGELNVKKKDGSFIDVYLSANIVKDRKGIPFSIMASFIDISQLKLLRDQLVRSERLAATGQLAVTIAHEINSPLQAITILLSMLKKKYPGDTKLLEKITLLKDAHTSIRDTVQKLLFLNRPRNVEKQWIDVNKLMENTVSLLSGYLKKNKINLTIDLNENLPKIHASPQQINQVFLNLVNNSIEAIENSKKACADAVENKIDISTSNGDKSVVISIADNGPGISEQDIKFIFDPFYTSKKQMGVGVGLSVCHAIVESHNGKIEVENLKSGGTIFTVTLPLDHLAVKPL